MTTRKKMRVEGRFSIGSTHAEKIASIVRFCESNDYDLVNIDFDIETNPMQAVASVFDMAPGAKNGELHHLRLDLHITWKPRVMKRSIALADDPSTPTERLQVLPSEYLAWPQTETIQGT